MCSFRGAQPMITGCRTEIRLATSSMPLRHTRHQFFPLLLYGQQRHFAVPQGKFQMREFHDHYEEEYVYLADLTDTAALLSWGKFFFADTMKLVPDRQIHLLQGQHGRHTSIGANCEPY